MLYRLVLSWVLMSLIPVDAQARWLDRIDIGAVAYPSVFKETFDAVRLGSFQGQIPDEQGHTVLLYSSATKQAIRLVPNGSNSEVQLEVCEIRPVNGRYKLVGERHHMALPVHQCAALLPRPLSAEELLTLTENFPELVDGQINETKNRDDYLIAPFRRSLNSAIAAVVNYGVLLALYPGYYKLRWLFTGVGALTALVTTHDALKGSHLIHSPIHSQGSIARFNKLEHVLIDSGVPLETTFIAARRVMPALIDSLRQVVR